MSFPEKSRMTLRFMNAHCSTTKLMALIWWAIVAAMHRLNRLNEALASFDRAAKVSPGYADAWNNRGTTLRELHHL
jgi:hypothetical protein